MNDVDKPIKAYEEMRENWDLTAALNGGTRAMRGAGVDYLPQEIAESDALYKIRLAKTVLFNCYQRTLNTLVGQPLEKDIKLSEDASLEVQKWVEDVDLMGSDLTVFGHGVFKAAINDGLTHILIDYPVTESQLTLADEREKGVRPYAVHVLARQVIGWRSALVSGKRTLTQLRIMEEGEQPDGDFDVVSVARVRVFDRVEGGFVRYRLYEEGTDAWGLIEEGELTPLTFIPLVTVYANQTGFMLAEPMLLDLAHLNIAHWQSSSDQRNILHVARTPILFFKGFTDENMETIEIGPNRGINGPENSDITYVEHTGAAIDSGRQDLEDLKAEMATLGFQLLVGTPGNVTATQKVLDKAESDSSLVIAAKNLQSGLTMVIQLMHEWVKKLPEQAGTVEVNTKFMIIDGGVEDLRILWDMRVNGDLSLERFRAEVQRRGVLGEDFDAEVEDKLLKEELAQRAAQIKLEGDDDDDEEEDEEEPGE